MLPPEITIHCEYCFLPYENCTCCIYCGFVKGTCECHLEGEYPCTKFHPSDMYKSFHTNKEMSEACGFYSLNQIDNAVMSIYIESVWPERLKK